jgi:hypothetical protein
MEARERALAESVSARLKEQFGQERRQLEVNAHTALEQASREHAAAIAAVKGEVAQREAAARADGAKAAQTASEQKILGLEQGYAELRSEAAKKLAAQVQARELAESNARQSIAAAETAKTAAENEAKAVRANHEAAINERLHEQREALEKAKTAAVLAEQAKTFAERQKLTMSIQELQRQLARERADILGEGAELDLYEELKSVFVGDRIRRVPKGTAGADIIHEVVENGNVCGKIVYDSKNRSSWRAEYATKLCEDKIAEGACHAILSVLKFPAEAKQLDVRDGVILANPARVAAVAEILRDHIVQNHELRVSNEEREEKQGALYAYITSERFHQHLDSIEAQNDRLLDLDVDEQRAHQALWEKRGKLLKGMQKAQGNLRADVGRIIGTDSAGA